MSISRRLLLAAAFVATLPVAALAGDPPYLDAGRLDLLRFLPPPAATGSADDLADRAGVVAAQKAASPERIAQAVADAEQGAFVTFRPTLGPKFEASALPLARRLFDRVGDGADAVVDPVKPIFGRQRPFRAAPEEIRPLMKPAKGGSYPSSHTTRATTEGIVLAAMVPEKRAEIWARIDDYAQSRVILGMHHPSDVAAGKRAGTAVAATLFADPAFVADFEAAKAEVRAALGF